MNIKQILLKSNDNIPFGFILLLTICGFFLNQIRTSCMMYQFTIGELFEALRRVDGLSQVQLAKELDIVQSTISKMERNVSDVITFDLVNKMSSLSGTDLRCFQKGFLSNAPKKLKSILPATYTRSAEFSARSVFLLLEEIYPQKSNNLISDPNIIDLSLK